MARRRLADITDPCMIFIGSVNTASDYEWLTDNNIKVILNVCNDVEPKFYNNFVYAKWGMDDPQEGFAPRNNVHIAAMLLAASAEQARVLGGNVLIHCAAGHNRSSLVAAKYLVRFKGWEFKKAVEAARIKDQKPWMVEQGFEWR